MAGEGTTRTVAGIPFAVRADTTGGRDLACFAIRDEERQLG